MRKWIMAAIFAAECMGHMVATAKADMTYIYTGWPLHLCIEKMTLSGRYEGQSLYDIVSVESGEDCNIAAFDGVATDDAVDGNGQLIDLLR